MTPPCVALPLYRPRDSRASDLWHLMDQHFPTFQQVYGERFHAKYGFWRPVVERLRRRAFLQCVDLGSHRGPGGPGRATAQGRPARSSTGEGPIASIFPESRRSSCRTLA